MIGVDFTVQSAVMRLIAGLIIVALQGAAIAATAVLLGDNGPRYDGRRTLAPWPHVDLIGLGTLILTGFGWGRSIDIDPASLRIGRWGLVVAVLAGSVALFIAAPVLQLLAAPLIERLDYTAGVTVAAFLADAARLCIIMGLLALLPIPPLAGAHFLTALGLPIPKQAGLYLSIVLLLASIFGVTRYVLKPAYDIIAPLLLGIDSFL
ncbi:hypothetical protein [Paradevosia shaoguanensis]|uniref:hypothetical protein n=1 Tax=Paradevosia shaoguanensis TaxID=1335043 RepID=UPI003C7464DE